MNDFELIRKRIGGVKGMMIKLGDAPSLEYDWEPFPKCPFCGVSEFVSVFAIVGVDVFLCRHEGCPSEAQALDDLAYLGLREGLSDEPPEGGGPSPVVRRFLELAGGSEELPKTAGTARNDVPDNRSALDPELIWKAIEVVKAAGRASVSLLKPELNIGQAHANRILNELEKRGLVGPVRKTMARKVLIFTKSLSISATRPENSAKISEEIIPGLAATRFFFQRLTWTHEHMYPDFQEGNMPPDVLTPEFVANLRFEPTSLLNKRGLWIMTCDALGYRANSPSNEVILREMYEKCPASELVKSGLWLEWNPEQMTGLRPNPEFHGMGWMWCQSPEVREAGTGGQVLACCQPTLIPYFDQAVRLIKLRPHKGAGPRDTIFGQKQIYVPRDCRRCADTAELFGEVILCMSEFDAAAFWQRVGLGRDMLNGAVEDWQWKPLGVCALPDPFSAADFNVRSELEDWLKAVRCSRVTIAFNFEDNGSLPEPQPPNTEFMARTLAIELASKGSFEVRLRPLPAGSRQLGRETWCEVLKDCPPADAGYRASVENLFL